MIEKKLKIICCENVKTEFIKARTTENLNEIKIINFKSFCNIGSGVIDNNEVIEQYQDNGEFRIIACKTCPIYNKIEPNEKDIVSFENIFNLFLDQEIVYKRIRDGAYFVTNDWLNNWFENVNNLGFSQKDSVIFFNEVAKYIYFINSYDEKSLSNINEFSNYINMRYETVEVDLTYLRLMLKLLNQEFSYGILKKANYELEEKNANYKVIFDLSNKFSKFDSFRELVNEIKTMLSMITGAKKVEFYFSENSNIDNKKYSKEFDYTIFENNLGFAFSISYSDEILAVIELNDFILKSNIEKYLRFCLGIRNFLSLTIINFNSKEEIIENARRDGLTGLYNRGYFNEIVLNSENLIDDYTIFIFDIDNLKIVNDNLGHSSGDILILNFVEVLNRTFRGNDYIFRIGGDEFLVILNNFNFEHCNQVKKRLSHNLELVNKKSTINHEYQLKFSYGCASLVENKDKDFNTIFKIADDLMYCEKRRKKSL